MADELRKDLKYLKMSLSYMKQRNSIKLGKAAEKLWTSLSFEPLNSDSLPMPDRQFYKIHVMKARLKVMKALLGKNE